MEFKMPAVAITDHGNMFGAIKFYQACMAKGIKPIIGCEIYLAPGSRLEKTNQSIQESSNHLILLAKDEEGYRNLMKLVSIGYLEGFYYKPRIDKEVLAQYSRGLIGLSSCLKGTVSRLLLNGRENEAKALLVQLGDIFGRENFYLELQNHSLPDQIKLNNILINLSKELNLPLVATNDVHYLIKEHARAHEVLLCLQTQTTLSDPNRMKYQTDEFYFKSPQEMEQLFSHIPEAISNTVLIAEKCNLELDFEKTYLPHYKPPPGKTRDDYLRELVEEGLKNRYGQGSKVIQERVEHELEIIKHSGFTSYFLIAWDFIHYAKQNKIPVGPGRGSAAGSVVSFALGITNIDPLKYDLIFERFLNPERITLPDIDIDFCYERRNEVIDYVVKKYGKDNVAQIITFGTMMAKAAIRDVARALDFTYGEADKIAKLIPTELNITLEQALSQEPELQNLYKADARIANLIDTAKILEGLTRHASTHAAGVVISEDPLTNHIPLFKTSDDQITTGYPMGSLEKIGLLKMDFLGLKTLTVIDETVKIIQRTKELNIDITKIPLEDKKAYELLSRAESMGIFQLESSGMRELLKKLSPSRFEDIIALLALYRPGPIGSGMVDDFIKRKQGKVAIKYDHKKLEPILKDTYGIIVYQEQVMRIVSNLAGFSLSQADSLRRAMGKKTPEIMDELRHSFIKGTLKGGIDKKVADRIFKLIEHFAGYGFNKSHSAAYALISYRTAYLKANYPIEFMTALLTSEMGNTDKVVTYINEAQRMGIKMLPPDVNESFAKFTMIDNLTIRFGLAAVKNVGRGAIDSIIEARDKRGEPFNSLYDFCEHVDLRLVNRKVIESLIKCGAFDNFGLYRAQLMSMIDKALEVSGVLQKDRSSGQLSFFDTFEHSDGFKKSFQEIPRIEEWSDSQKLSLEKEMLGFYVTGHPLTKYEKLLKDFANSTTSNLTVSRDGQEISLGGVINKLKPSFTKKMNEKMAFLTLEDLEGSVEVLVFPRVFKEVAQHLKTNAVVFVKGRLSLRDDQPKIIANEVIPVEEVRQRYTASVSVDLFTAGLDEKTLKSLKEILFRFPGNVPVEFNFTTGESQEVQLVVGKQLSINVDDEVISEIEKLVGTGTVTLKPKLNQR